MTAIGNWFIYLSDCYRKLIYIFKELLPETVFADVLVVPAVPVRIQITNMLIRNNYKFFICLAHHRFNPIWSWGRGGSITPPPSFFAITQKVVELGSSNLKGLKVLFHVTLQTKFAASDLQRYPWNLNQIKTVEDTVVVLTWKVLISVSFSIASCKKNAQVIFAENPEMKISLKEIKH